VSERSLVDSQSPVLAAHHHQAQEYLDAVDSSGSLQSLQRLAPGVRAPQGATPASSGCGNGPHVENCHHTVRSSPAAAALMPKPSGRRAVARSASGAVRARVLVEGRHELPFVQLYCRAVRSVGAAHPGARWRRDHRHRRSASWVPQDHETVEA